MLPFVSHHSKIKSEPPESSKLTIEYVNLNFSMKLTRGNFNYCDFVVLDFCQSAMVDWKYPYEGARFESFCACLIIKPVSWNFVKFGKILNLDNFREHFYCAQTCYTDNQLVNLQINIRALFLFFFHRKDFVWWVNPNICSIHSIRKQSTKNGSKN